MEQNLYDLMDWAGIEELVYSEGANPCRLLGPHMTDQGLLIQTLIPTAVKVEVKLLSTGKTYPMEMADEAGFFAVLIPRKNMTAYALEVTYDNGTTEELRDPYSFASRYTESDLKKFKAGIHYQIYEKMGAHPMTIDGVEGVYFSVWAPCAMRVSVVGDFNLWDGRRHPMERLGDSGIFQLFIPGLKAGEIYKYEVKTQRGEPMLKADPYGHFSELRPNTASVIWDIDHYQWQDQEWMKKRAASHPKEEPMLIYEVHLGSWMRHPLQQDEEGKDISGTEFYHYREIAPLLADYVKQMGYTHVELLPVMEHPLDASWGYQVTGYYAPTSRYGNPDDFMYFMDYMHGRGIGVILDWVPAHFPRDAHGLACFDGTCVYEHQDPRKGSHPHWGTLIYNYGRPEVSNFLIANALFWADKYHADGIRMDAVASMLYLDYGKQDGEWVPNIYGGNENLEAVEFLKHLSSVFKGRKDGAVLIAEESTAWPMVTGKPEDGGLGFDFKWNMGWMNDFTSYMRCDPYFRKYNYGELTFSMLYAYSENFVLVFSHDEVVHGKGSMIGKMPGETLEQKAQNLRTAYGFMTGHPGKKLLFMGQDFAQVDEWNENASLEWNLTEYPVHQQMQDYVKALNHLYLSHPALYEKDYDPEGFQWINCSYDQESMVIFIRRSKKKEETLLFVCNFDNITHEKFRLGVPFAGKYKEILNSDAAEFGGSGMTNSRVKNSKAIEWDELENSIEIRVAPMSCCVFSCTPAEEEKPKKEKKGTKTSAAVKRPEDSGTSEKKDTSARTTRGRTVKERMQKLAEKKDELGKKASQTVETVQKLASEKVEKLTTKKVEPEKLSTKKVEAEKLSTKKVEPEKLSTKKIEAEKLSTKKVEPEKLSTKKVEAEKLSTKKVEPEKLSTKKVEAEKLSTKKVEPEKLSTKKVEAEKLSTKKVEPEKISTKKVEEEEEKPSVKKDRKEK